MKRDEDIFNIFREDQGKLSEKPSARAWNRLEKKLDARHKKQRKIFYFQAFAAASLALILAMVTAISVFDSTPNNSAMVEGAEHHDSMTLTATTDSEVGVRDYHEPLIMTHIEQKRFEEKDSKYHQLANNQIAESKLDPSKKLKYKFEDDKSAAPVAPSDQLALVTPKPETSDRSSVKTEEQGPLDSDNKSVSGNKAGDQANQLGKNNEFDNITNTGDSENNGFASPTNDDVIPEFEAIEPAEKPVVSKEDVESINRKDLPEMRSEDQQWWENDTPGGYVTHSENLEKERTAEMIDARKEDRLAQAGSKNSEKKKKPGKARLKSPALADQVAEEEIANDTKEEIAVSPSNTIDLDASMNAISYESLEDKGQLNDIRLFEWLIGEWVNDNGKSAEEWTRTDELTISGKGSFMVNGEVLFTESMKIRKIDNSLYFIVAVDSTNTENYYRLTRYNGNEAVFENSNLGFPNQVIIQRNSDDNFSTIMQNSAPTQITDPQQGYLLNRNQITNERAFRNLKRAND